MLNHIITARTTTLTAALWSLNLSRGAWLFRFQMYSWLSLPPLASSRSSGDHLRPQTCRHRRGGLSASDMVSLHHQPGRLGTTSAADLQGLEGQTAGGLLTWPVPVSVGTLQPPGRQGRSHISMRALLLCYMPAMQSAVPVHMMPPACWRAQRHVSMRSQASEVQLL